MASFIATLQSSTPSILFRCEKVRFTARDSGLGRLRISVYGRDFTTSSIGLPHHVVCSTSSRSRDPSIRRSSRSPNRNRGGASKPVSILPGDMKLLQELQDFISSADLPPHQVPSTRELASRGRQDLANAVRRRGEKAISQLLSNPNFLSSSGTTKQSKSMPATPRLKVDETFNGTLKPEVVPSPSIRPQVSADAPQTTDLVPQSISGLLIPHYEAAVERGPSNSSNQNDSATVDDSIEVTNFGSSSVNHDGRKRTQGLPRTLDVAKRSAATDSFEADSDDEDESDEVDTYEDSSDDEVNNRARLEAIKSPEESQESEAWQNAAVLRSKLIAFFDNRAGKSMGQTRTDPGAVFDIMTKPRESERFLRHGEGDKDLLSSVGADPAPEIARLSALLHAKEMENLRISRELEEAKAMLALVRAKQSAELAQAKQVAVEQDLRLSAAEQALQSLKLTQVDWWGKGNRVELAGSFNGWQHHAYLLPDLSDQASKMPGTRGLVFWRTELWLYPGVYEIKFIVDGKWVLDDRREVIQGHMGENNLLYVDP